MIENAQHIIHRLAATWQRNKIILFIAAVVAISTVVAMIGTSWFNWPSWLIPFIFSGVAIIAWILKPVRRTSTGKISSLLNYRYPELEESAQLLLLPEDQLLPLQRMQQQKTAAAMLTIRQPAEAGRPLELAGMALGGAILLATLIWYGKDFFQYKHVSGIPPVAPQTKQRSPVPAGIASFTLLVTPPAYTRLPSREEDAFSISVEEGSKLTWTINSTAPLPSLDFIFNNRDKRKAITAPGDSSSWTFSQTALAAGFYQLQLGEKLSELYRIDVIPDKPPVIQVNTPKQYSSIPAGQQPLLRINAAISDDYGISYARLMVTKASGKGESVSFKEDILSFDQSATGQRQLALSRTLDLGKMGLNAGDELYFYILIKDNHGQESRSDMFFISMADTEELLSMSGLTSGVDQVPEYFRSQRQIILDTEKLLKEQDSMPADSFKLKSNELGNDQKLLRLRYGKFLGEENESGGHSPDDGHDHNGAETPAYGDVQTLMDQLAHKHDNAEDAGFFEPAQKAQLKAVLAEMWTSELKLRTYAPAAALPFEYKALILLKDLQQRSRAYVGKTSIKKNTLNPDKRLSADQSKILGDPSRKTIRAPEPSIQQLRHAISFLELMDGTAATAEAQQALLIAEQKISDHAITEPAIYLPALSAIRSIRKNGKPQDKKQLRAVQSALKKIIGESLPLPRSAPANSQLSTYYFNQLNKAE